MGKISAMANTNEELAKKIQKKEARPVSPRKMLGDLEGGKAALSRALYDERQRLLGIQVGKRWACYWGSYKEVPLRFCIAHGADQLESQSRLKRLQLAHVA